MGEVININTIEQLMQFLNENGFIGCDNHSFIMVDRLESG